MNQIQIIREKQLAAEVYAQRLAYISLTGKEPDANDTITLSGYLNCWNDAIAAVGDPFTDSGQVVLAKLQQKATFHGQKKLYHKDFLAFFFRVLYVHFEEDSPFNLLPPWQELKFSNDLPCPISGVVNWLEASLGDQMRDDNDSHYILSLLECHSGITSAFLEACCIWAQASPHLPKIRVSYRDNGPDSAIRLRITDSVLSVETQVISSIKHLPFAVQIQQNQVSCRLAVEKEIYRKLFFVDPGNWCLDNYISGATRVLNHWTGSSDLLAVKLAEAIREEAGFARSYILNDEKWAPTDGWHYDPAGGDAHIAFDEGKNEQLMSIESDIYDIETDAIVNHLYHPDFLPAFLYKLGVGENTHTSHITACWPRGIRWNWFEDQELKAGTPARLEYTAHWLGITYKHFTVSDWQYLISILTPILEIQIESTENKIDKETNQLFSRKIVGKMSDKYPTVQRAVDYAKFKVATMPTAGQSLLFAPASPKQLASPTLEGQPVEVPTPQPAILGLTWQGPRTEFVELACSLYEAGAITIDGLGGRDAVVERLGSALGVKGKTPVSTVLQDIKNKRNGDRQTPLLDRLKTRFLDYLGK